MKILIVCEQPLDGAARDAKSWINVEAGKLLAADGIEKVTITEVGTAGARHPRIWDWLVEAELEHGADPAAVTEQPAFAALMHELRSLQMHPATMVLDRARGSTFSRADT